MSDKCDLERGVGGGGGGGVIENFRHFVLLGVHRSHEGLLSLRLFQAFEHNTKYMQSLVPRSTCNHNIQAKTSFLVPKVTLTPDNLAD